MFITSEEYEDKQAARIEAVSVVGGVPFLLGDKERPREAPMAT
ncbi:MAG: hypothetical protein PF444_01870 [Bacteroidales bacterium]|nr:hypothetical protein [Bacteroidales bacterium]